MEDTLNLEKTLKNENSSASAYTVTSSYGTCYQNFLFKVKKRIMNHCAQRQRPVKNYFALKNCNARLNFIKLQ